MSDNAQGKRAATSPFARSSDGDGALFRSNPFESGAGRGSRPPAGGQGGAAPAGRAASPGSASASQPQRGGQRNDPPRSATERAQGGDTASTRTPGAPARDAEMARGTDAKRATESPRPGGHAAPSSSTAPAAATGSPRSAANPTASTPSGGAKAAAGAPKSSSSRSQATTAAPARRTRKARLRLSRIDPWSVMKTALMFSIAWGIITVTAMAVLWGVLQSSGAFDSINTTVNDLLATPNSPSSFDLGAYITRDRVLGYTVLIAAADVVLFTALATLFSFLYNLAATVLGGLEVTLAED